MRAPLLLLAALGSAACSSPVADSSGGPEPDVARSIAPGCYALQLGGRPSPDVSLPSLIELASDPAPGFAEPRRFAVREPGANVPQAPVSSWVPLEAGGLELALGGGYTGYTFILRGQGNDWVGEGTYCADFGLEPTPPPLPARLTPTSCP
jgi:hypothetical protein